MKISIVFLDRGTLGVPLRKPGFPCDYREFDATSVGEIVERARGATVAIINKVPLRAATLRQLPALKLIAVAATGTDCIDKDYCRASGIAIANIRNYAVNTVPEHTLALIFALKRSLLAYAQDSQRGKWRTVDQFCYFDHPIRDVAGSTLGIVGYGALGRAVGGRAEALGMRVLATDTVTFDGMVDLDTILSASDVVTLHCPLTDRTRNLIGAQQLKRMKPGAILINTARGGLVDEAALAEALKVGRIGGAGIDVLTEEPPRAANPLLDLKLPNLIVTPHVAWASREAMERLAEQLVGNIEAWAAGTPRNLVGE